MKPTLLLYCQHSVGIGHLTRSFAIASALAAHFRVVFLNGGPIPAGIATPEAVEFIHLSPMGSDDGHALVSRGAQTSVSDAASGRRDRILGALREHRPDVLMIELFPFGRKKFAFELLPLLREARRADRAPLVISSLRDLLVGSRPDQQHHDNRAAWLCNRYFDAVLVHADPRLARLEDTFRPRRPLTTPVLYTGFVAPPPLAPAARGRHVLVTAGGGMVGAPLFNAAIDAHRSADARTRPPMRLIAGPFLPQADWESLQQRAAGCPDLQLLRSVPQLAPEMRAAALSVSQCGYNSAMDILSTGVPALVVPYSAGREDEQRNRAQRLSQLGLLRWLDASLLNGDRLAQEIRRTLAFTPCASSLDTQGAGATAAIVANLLNDARRERPCATGSPA